MTPMRLPNVTEESSAIRVGIVCGPETTVLVDSLEALLAEAKGFTFSRFEYRFDSGLKPHAAGFGNPDVVVATLGAFPATNVEPFFASLQRVFPHRIAALDEALNIAGFSNGGTLDDGGQIDLAGPGVRIFSAAPHQTGLVRKSGTSMATPHVAGLAALYAQAFPASRGLALKALLLQNAKRLSLPSTDVGSGLVQAPQA